MGYPGVELLLKGVAIGFSASVPLGPIGVLCVQRTINKGKVSGFISGMGAAASDTLYAIIAGLGLTYIINFLQEQQNLLQLIGGVFLIFLGVKIFYSNPIHEIRKQKRKKNNLIEDFASVLLLTLSNPLAAFLFIAIFAGLGLVKESDPSLTFAIVGGVFLGASLWWFILTTLVGMFRKKFRLKQLWWINKISGAAIVIFGLVAIVSLLIISSKII